MGCGCKGKSKKLDKAAVAARDQRTAERRAAFDKARAAVEAGGTITVTRR